MQSYVLLLYNTSRGIKQRIKYVINCGFRIQLQFRSPSLKSIGNTLTCRFNDGGRCYYTSVNHIIPTCQ